jgi:hypothetical protein
MGKTVSELTLVQGGGQQTEGAVAPVISKEPNIQISDGFASVSFRKNYPKRLVNAMAGVNNAQLVETDDAYVLSAPYIKISRRELEAVIGPMTDAKWRIMFVNRVGEVKEFNNYEFAVGTPRPVETVEEEAKDTVQLNIRIDRAVKDELEKYRGKEYLDMTQNAFVEEALKEFIANIRKEVL